MYKQNAHLTVKSVYLAFRAEKFSNLKLNCHISLGISWQYYRTAASSLLS